MESLLSTELFYNVWIVFHELVGSHPLSSIQRICKSHPTPLHSTLFPFHDVGNHAKVEAISFPPARRFPRHQTAFRVTSRPLIFLFFSTWSKRGRQWISGDYHRPLRVRYLLDSVTQQMTGHYSRLCVGYSCGPQLYLSLWLARHHW